MFLWFGYKRGTNCGIYLIIVLEGMIGVVGFFFALITVLKIFFSQN